MLLKLHIYDHPEMTGLTVVHWKGWFELPAEKSWFFLTGRYSCGLYTRIVDKRRWAADAAEACLAETGLDTEISYEEPLL
jgi:hypothetical protein